MLKSFFVFIVIAFASVVLETSLFSNMIFLPAVPDFLLLCLVYVSINNGSLYGTTAGFISGLFLDFMSSSPFGLNCFLRTIIGYIAGRFNKTLNINGFLLPEIIGICTTLLKVFVIWLISIFFPKTIFSYNLVSVNFLFELVMNAILTPLIFRFLDIFSGLLLFDSREIA